MKSPNSKSTTATTTAPAAADIDWAALKARAPKGPAPTTEEIATMGDGVYLPAGTTMAERQLALAGLVERQARTRRRGERGAQKAPTKEQATLRYPAGALDLWRSTGPGWQARLGEWVAMGSRPFAHFALSPFSIPAASGPHPNYEWSFIAGPAALCMAIRDRSGDDYLYAGIGFADTAEDARQGAADQAKRLLGRPGVKVVGPVVKAEDWMAKHLA